MLGDIDAMAQKTKKKKKTSQKSSAAANAYQDLTSRYNRYFNAKMNYQDGIKQLSDGNKDDYEELLNIYEYKSGDGTAISGNLDAIIKKTSIAIQIKPNSKWVDDCYLLLGKAYYLQGDNESAAKAFTYISSSFKNNVRKSYDRRSRDKQKQLREKEQAKDKKAKEDAKKDREKEIAKEKADREKAKKERDKEKNKKQKEREKSKKAKAKEKKAREKAKAKERKLKEKAKKKRQKEKEKNKKRRKKGKAPIKSSASSSSSGDDKAKKKATKEKNKKEAEKEAKRIAEEEAEAIAEMEAAKKAEEEAEAEAAEDVDEDYSEGIVKSGSGKEKSYKTNGPLGFLAHKPVSYDALMWLGRTFIDEDNFSSAEGIIQGLQNDKNFPKRISGDLNALEAHYHLRKENWGKAKNALQTAIDNTRKKKDKARLHFILAQLEQRSGNYAEAVKSYKKVLKSKPEYDMEFNARLNIAKTKMQSGEFSGDRAIAYLKRMLKDGKNEEYQDQIYFAMAEIAMESGNEELANEYLAQSAKNSTANPDQKAKSYLRLAEINYEKERYLQASAYYDSTMTVLPKTHKKYDEVAERANSLRDLAMHLKTVERKDSLRRIADMPEGKRTVFIEELIAQLEKEAQDKAAQEFLEDNSNADKSSSNTGGTWYFYNDVAKANGETEFAIRWGSRSLNDNWRISSKTTGSDLTFTTDTTTVSRDLLVDRAARGLLSKDDILAELPLTKAQKTASDDAVIDALYNIGRIYHVRLEKNDKSRKAFGTLQDRFPDNKHSAATYYNLYLMAINDKKVADAKKYKSTIINDYPKSKYAKLLQDDGFLAELMAQEKELEVYYDKTYAFFKAENYSEVTRRGTEVNTLFEENSLQPKFDLLAAMVVGATEEKKAYIKALKDVIRKYPEDEVKDKAEEILSYIDTKGGKKTTGKVGKYSYKPNTRHYLVVAFDSYTANISTLTNSLSDFNTSNFAVAKLKVNQMLLDPKNQIVLVKQFNNAAKAQVYYKTLQQNESEIFKGLGTTVKYFTISKSNFTQYFKAKDSAAYYEFFLANYK